MSLDAMRRNRLSVKYFFVDGDYGRKVCLKRFTTDGGKDIPVLFLKMDFVERKSLKMEY